MDKLTKQIKVRNLFSNHGNMIPNQFEIVQTKKNYHCSYFQSYDTIIAKIEIKNNIKQIILDTHALNYSRTTSKYLYNYMKMNRKEIENLIKKNKIKLKNLN